MSATGDGPADLESFSATRIELLDRVCDRFEAALRAGVRPKIEHHLAEVEEPLRAAVLGELISLEIHWRRSVGGHPEAGEYRSRFPAHAGEVAAAFARADASPPAGTERARSGRDTLVDEASGLLLALLAFRNDFIDLEALVAALGRSGAGQLSDPGKFLVERGDLDAEAYTLFEGLVHKHVQVRGGDPEKSLAALARSDWIRGIAMRVADPEIQATLDRVGLTTTSADHDHDRTTSCPVSARNDGGRFRVQRRYAKGGLGVVFVALDAELNREVALKQIREDRADDPVSRRRFVNEAEVTGALEHPGIVPVYGMGTYPNGRPYYAMRLIRGTVLEKAIKQFHAEQVITLDPSRRSLELRKLLRRFLDVCDAVGYAHSRGVLHRDIKPSNIILGKYGETLLLDWGLAKATGLSEPGSEETTIAPSHSIGPAETQPGSALGTPGYMSPEQAAGDLASLGPTSDVYSLGATLYCLLVGREPFDGVKFSSVLDKVERGEFPRPRIVRPAIPKPLEAICLRAMALKPSDRYGTPKAMAEDVERWMADEPVTAWREPVLVRVRRWARRHRTGLIVGTAALVLAIGLATMVETIGRNQASTWLSRLRNSTVADLAPLFAERETRDWRVRGTLNQMFERGTPPHKLAAALFLANEQPKCADYCYARLLDADAREIKPIANLLSSRMPGLVSRLWASVESVVAPADVEKESHDRRRANAACALALLGESSRVWALLRSSPDPQVRSMLIDQLGPAGVDPNLVWERLAEAGTPVSIRIALIQSLGGIPSDAWPSQLRATVVNRLIHLYRDDPDRGIHSSAKWLLLRWGYAAKLTRIDTDLARGELHRPDFEWRITRTGLTLITVKLPALDRIVEISDTEITVDTYKRFKPDAKYAPEFSPDPLCPINAVSYHEAAAFCNWLNGEEGIPPEDAYYRVTSLPDKSNLIVAEHRDHKGFRLPTNEEFDVLCAAGTSTKRYHGDCDSLLARYAWTLDNSGGRTHPVASLLPNDFGFFDTLGNIQEWCEGQSPRLDSLPVGGDLRGGWCIASPASLVDRHLVADNVLRDYVNPTQGFRVVRTKEGR
jgi:tRNA A-37 threonylcarbamoyl transferase component Bud32